MQTLFSFYKAKADLSYADLHVIYESTHTHIHTFREAEKHKNDTRIFFLPSGIKYMHYTYSGLQITVQKIVCVIASHKIATPGLYPMRKITLF